MNKIEINQKFIILVLALFYNLFFSKSIIMITLRSEDMKNKRHTDSFMNNCVLFPHLRSLTKFSPSTFQELTGKSQHNNQNCFLPPSLCPAQFI